MANLKAIRNRIQSVKGTQKITRAMKMVAAAKLRRAQENILALRPYAADVMKVLADVAALTEADDHPLLARRDPNKVMLVVLTSDRGLCGGFNTNINKNTDEYVRKNKESHEDISLGIIGRKGLEYFRRRDFHVRHEILNVFEDLSWKKAADVARTIIHDYSQGELDAVYLVYNEFKSVISQKVVIEPLLPIVPAEAEEGRFEFIYEPNKKALLDRLLPMYVEVEVYRALLESVASEHGARMTAMDNATKNAGEMIDSLTLQYNKARQAAITSELLEVVGGAEALKG
jgi:F-type H+-transporting ATPase subunit gamma